MNALGQVNEPGRATDLDLVGQEIIQRHSKSFALASRLLPPEARSNAVAVYAWCRRADDAIDLAEFDQQRDALGRLESELQEVHSDASMSDPVLQIFQRAVHDCAIPIAYPRDLLSGMRMDAEGRRYETMDDLLDYCYHVAGCVGLMMCHVMGVADDKALANAAHLGMAMQLTNICRDVAEDWERGRLYLPNSVLEEHGAPGLVRRISEPFPLEARIPTARTIAHLLAEADRYYASGDEGMPALEWRCALSIRTARVVYSSIGKRIQDQKCDPLAGRAFVSGREKMVMALGSVAASIGDLPNRMIGRGMPEPRKPGTVLRFPDDILPLSDDGSQDLGVVA
jgi:phytoene synthase